MIVKNKYGEYTITCDCCSDFLDTIEVDFRSALEEAKKAGWSVVYDSEYYVYSHYCPECKGKHK